MKIFLGLFSWLGSATPSGIGEENWAGTMNLSDKENLGTEKVADSSEEEYQKIASVIDDVFGELFKTNTIKEGAMFTIEFSPEHGVRLNYDEVGDLPYIKEEGFDQPILRAWLGDNPISLEMKKDLLGQH